MYDLLIVGSGPAGLTASIYASCYHIKHLVIGEVSGGLLQSAPDILNYPGFENITGKELTERMVNQAIKRGGEIITGSIVNISHNKDDNSYSLTTKDGKIYQGMSVIIATGTERRKLNVKGEAEYTGRGVHYCATCEKFDYENKVCAVVGGGNSALQAAVELSKGASKVYIVYRGDVLRGDAVWLNTIEKDKTIETIFNTIVMEITGDGKKVTGVKVTPVISHFDSNKIAESKILLVDKIFIEIGGVPGSALIIPLGVEVTGSGHIKINERLETNIPGIFAAGDLVSSALSIEQISTAVGLGARAASSVFSYLNKIKAPVLWGESQIKR